MKNEKNKQMIIVVGIILLLIVGGVFLTRGSGSGRDGSGNDADSTLPNVEELPSVDDSVGVELEQVLKGKEVNIVVTDYPKGTTEINYTITYNALKDGKKVSRGARGKLVLDNKEKSAVNEKVIVLGTQSGKNKTYDDVDGPIRIDLRFEGDYGAQLYQGEFEL